MVVCVSELDTHSDFVGGCWPLPLSYGLNTLEKVDTTDSDTSNGEVCCQLYCLSNAIHGIGQI